MMFREERPYNRSLVQADDFDLNEFLLLTRDASFQKLSTVLGDHLEAVKKEMGDLVNAEFDNFIGLYSEIGQTGFAEIQQFRQHAYDIFNSFESIRKEVEQMMEKSDSTLEKLETVLVEENSLKRQQEFSHAVDSIKELIYCDNLEMASGFLVKTKALLAFNPSLHNLTDLLEETSDLLFAELKARLKTTLQNANCISELKDLARAFVTLGNFVDFERIFVETISLPFCNYKFSMTNYETLMASQRSTFPLEHLFEESIKFIQDSESAYVQHLSGYFPSSRPLRLNIFVTPLLEALREGLPVIFSPSAPESFPRAYNSSQYFLKRMLSMYPNEASAMVAHESWVEFTKSWQIGIFYQLQFRSVATELEESLDVSLPIIDFHDVTVDLSKYSLRQFSALEEILHKLWDGTIIASLIPKYFRLTLQTVGRFIDWLVSFPKEFESTELGLSALILKSKALIKVQSLMEDLYTDTIAPKIENFKIDVSSFKHSLEHFIETKWIAGKQHLHSIMSRSLRLVGATRTKALLEAILFKSEIAGPASLLDVLNPILNEMLETDDSLQESLVGIGDDFAILASPIIDAAAKAAANVKRLQSLLKEQPLSEEDQKRLDDEVALKTKLKSEIVSLSSECKALGVQDLIKAVPKLAELYSNCT